MAIEYIKTVEPSTGIQTDLLGLLTATRDMLADEGNWVQGYNFCTFNDEHKPTCVPEVQKSIVDKIMRDGLCGQGWGVCAMGGVSMHAGNTAIIEYSGENSPLPNGAPSNRIMSLVTDEGDARTSDSLIPLPARQALHRDAYKALSKASRDLYCVGNIISLNDEHAPDGKKETVHAKVLACFDHAIQAEKDRLAEVELNSKISAEVRRQVPLRVRDELQRMLGL